MEKIKNLPPFTPEQTKSFNSFDEISKDPKHEGLRPDRQYAGGHPDETVIIAGKRYKKRPALTVETNSQDEDNQRRPYTEKEYYSHSTPGVGPGPGWDFRRSYLEDGWNIDDGKPDHLSDLPLYELISDEE
ncbi:MAG: hypothetical protein RDU25_05195 [Patescibacteria group bacterium]|nr:hypothetical protein [Patescibacteria group bacterium]